jgi:hypothetical protein
MRARMACLGEGVEHVRLGATDARARERGDVAVAAVLALAGWPWSEPRQRSVGTGSVRTAEGPTLGPGVK